MSISKSFKKFILKKMIKDAKYNPVSKLFEIDQAGLSTQDLRDIEMEGKLYNYSTDDITDFIYQITEEGFEMHPKTQLVRKIDPMTLKLEQQIKLTFLDDDRHNVDELLKIGTSEFLLIDHDRGALKPGEILKTTTSPWDLNSTVKFELVDEDNLIKYYSTGKIIRMELIEVPDVFDILQTKEAAFRRTVYAKRPEQYKGFKNSELSMDLEQGRCYSITQNGGLADFSFLEAEVYDIKKVLKNMDEIILPACDFENRPSADTEKIITLEKGMLSYRDGYWEIKTKAKIEFA